MKDNLKKLAMEFEMTEGALRRSIELNPNYIEEMRGFLAGQETRLNKLKSDEERYLVRLSSNGVSFPEYSEIDYSQIEFSLLEEILSETLESDAETDLFMSIMYYIEVSEMEEPQVIRILKQIQKNSRIETVSLSAKLKVNRLRKT